MGTSIQVSEVSLFSKNEDPIFRNLNFSVPEQIISNIILSDRQKIDALLEILIGEKKPDRGQVLVAGRNVVRSSEKNLLEMRKKDIGFVPRNFKLPFKTVKETLNFKMRCIGTPYDTDNKIEEALKRVGLKEKGEYENTELTQLERVKLAFALALVNKPRLLISNQPFKQLEDGEREEILQILQNYCERGKMTVVIATETPLEEDSVRKIDLSGTSSSDSL